jgi:hypothetical protein
MPIINVVSYGFLLVMCLVELDIASFIHMIRDRKELLNKKKEV